MNLAVDLKETQESLNRIQEPLEKDKFKQFCDNIRESTFCYSNYAFSSDLNDFKAFYGLAFNSLKKPLEFLAKNDPNPGLMNA